MPVDLFVEIGLPEDSDAGDAWDVRDGLLRRAEGAGMPARWIGGGTQFDPLVVDAQYEAAHERDALLAAGHLTVALLREGFAVRTRGEKLVHREHQFGDDPAPGTAYVQICTPLGLPA